MTDTQAPAVQAAIWPLLYTWLALEQGEADPQKIARVKTEINAAIAAASAPPAPTLQRMIAEARPFVIPAELIAAGDALAGHAQTVMDNLAQYGPSIVPHLLDDDENPGEYLRQAITAWQATAHPEA